MRSDNKIMVYGIILSGGMGARFGGTIPKQYIEVNGRPIIADCIDTFEACKLVDKYVIVAAAEWEDYLSELISNLSVCNQDLETANKFCAFAVPGENRQLSIYSGLKVLSDRATDDDIVIIHDAARPFVTEDILNRLINACENADGAMPALPVKDTMYIQENGRVKALIDRENLIAGQAPEAFRYGKYLKANEVLLPDKILSIKGSTEPAFLAGVDIAVVPGDESNFKITTKEDLDRYLSIKQNA